MPRSARVPLPSWRRNATRSCWGCSSSVPRRRKRLPCPKPPPAPAKGKRGFPYLQGGDSMSAALEVTRQREKLSSLEPAPQTRKRVVIIGGGFAGIAAARALRRCDAEIVLIDRRNHHIFQPLLYQVATAVLAPADIAAPIRQIEERQKNLTVMLAEVTAVDLVSRSVSVSYSTSGTRKITFDFLVISAGMQSSYFGH